MPTEINAGAISQSLVSGGGGPLHIRRGGSYSGNWSSEDPETPAVTVETTEPVILRNCQVSGRGHLIRSVTPGSNITVTDCLGLGRDPNRAGAVRGRFIAVYRPASLSIEHNYLVSTSGIYVDGGGHSAGQIVVRFNRAHNIDGRLSDGRGGFTSDSVKVQFVQLNNLRRVTQVSVAWNEVLNEPGQSRVEDVISLHRSSGSAEHPIRIEHNFLSGAYASKPESEAFSGGGIIVDGSAERTDRISGHVLIADNHILNTSNHGIAVSAGVDVRVLNNRLYSTGRLADGRQIRAANVGIYVWDIYGDRAKGAFGRHQVSGNRVVWWNHKGQRNDRWFADCHDSDCADGASSPTGSEPLTHEEEWRLWQSKLKLAHIRLGPRTVP